jgi:hypothetical protein
LKDLFLAKTTPVLLQEVLINRKEVTLGRSAKGRIVFQPKLTKYKHGHVSVTKVRFEQSGTGMAHEEIRID